MTTIECASCAAHDQDGNRIDNDQFDQLLDQNGTRFEDPTAIDSFCAACQEAFNEQPQP